MDLLQRAADLLERAQSRVADAANQGNRPAATAQIKALEARHADLRRRIEQSALELGKLAFRRWKSGAVADDPAMTQLCEQLDRLNNEYQYVAGVLTDARGMYAGYGPQPYPQPAPANLPPPYPQPLQAALPPAPPTAFGRPRTPQAPPPQADPWAGAPPAIWSPPAAPVVPPPVQRPLKPDRECPECLASVPGTTDYCPVCGMKV